MKSPFLFGIHCHQPAENFYHVVDHAVKASYAPFLEVALKHPKFKFACHYSGWLLEYIRTNHRGVFKNLQKLTTNGQAEMFTGGFYEPILTAIPSDDRRGQVDMLSKYIKKYFGQTPKGIWLTERVWDPSIVPDIVALDIENVIIDDYHLIAAGFPKENISGYFKTEQDGCMVNLFPIDMGLRYLTPFKPEQEVLSYMKSRVADGAKLLTCFDDGEKFGLWPKTNEWVYAKGWLDRFIDTICNDDEFVFSHYAEVAENTEPAGMAYLPITSYEEMGEWSLFSDRFERFEKMKKFIDTTEFKADSEQFLKGSVWKNFLVKYPESNRLHKKTLDLSLRSRQYKKDKTFIDLLYRSQCNDSLWHGVFGGLYLPNLRNNAWRPLIEAEKKFEELAGLTLPLTELRDMDFDGYKEVYVRNKNFNSMFVSRDGGQLVTIELKDKFFNLLNTISRKHEGYHSKFLIEDGTKHEAPDDTKTIHEQTYSIPKETLELIAYDWYNKNCFIDHFVAEYDYEQFKKCTFNELGDFVNQPFDVSLSGDNIEFVRNGGLYLGDKKVKTSFKKIYNVTDKAINFNFEIKSAEKNKCIYVSEYNFHFADVTIVTINGNPIDKPQQLKGNKFKISDPYLNKSITFEFENNVTFSWYLIYTISQSESGVDLSVQGVTFLASTGFDNFLSFKGNMTIS